MDTENFDFNNNILKLVFYYFELIKNSAGPFKTPGPQSEKPRPFPIAPVVRHANGSRPLSVLKQLPSLRRSTSNDFVTQILVVLVHI